MAGNPHLWSKTAADNDDADATVNWLEGQLPSTVNNSARAMMASWASWRDDNNGTLSTAGSSNTYTIAAPNVSYTLIDGLTISARANHTNTGAATLNVNSLGAKAIRGAGDVALVANQIKSGAHYKFQYNSSANSAAGAWMVINETLPLTLSSSAVSPVTTDTLALGTTSLMWSDHFKASGHVDNWNNGNITLTHASGQLTMSGSGTARFDIGNTNAFANLIINGSGSGTGGGAYAFVLNNDANVIGIGNKSAFTGGSYSATPYVYTGASGATSVEFSSGATFGNTISPTTTDGGALGTSSLMWSDHFKASGHVDNWNNGNLTLTHTAGTLTLGGSGSTRLDVGTGDAISVFIANGSGSGTAGGGYAAVYNNDANVIAIGNKSAIQGGAYSATPHIYSGSGGATAVEFSNGAVFNGPVSGVTTLGTSGLLTLTGGQIAFPATASISSNANTLDDYEEGTFTPSLLFGGGNTDLVASVSNGRYTKIGRIVAFTIYITLTAKGSSTGDATITNLPFTSVNGVINPLASYFAIVSSVSGHAMPIVSTSTTTVLLRHLTSGTTASNMTQANFNDTSTINIQGYLETAS